MLEGCHSQTVTVSAYPTAASASRIGNLAERASVPKLETHIYPPLGRVTCPRVATDGASRTACATAALTRWPLTARSVRL